MEIYKLYNEMPSTMAYVVQFFKENIFKIFLAFQKKFRQNICPYQHWSIRTVFQFLVYSRINSFVSRNSVSHQQLTLLQSIYYPLQILFLKYCQVVVFPDVVNAHHIKTLLTQLMQCLCNYIIKRCLITHILFLTFAMFFFKFYYQI